MDKKIKKQIDNVEEDAVLYSTKYNGTEYRLMSNGEVKYAGASGGFFRVPMRPLDNLNGRVMEQEGGVKKLVWKMLRDKNITNEQKFINSQILAPEYFGKASIMKEFEEIAVNIESPTGSFRMIDWLVLMETKFSAFKLMEVEAKEFNRKNVELKDNLLNKAKASVQEAEQ